MPSSDTERSSSSSSSSSRSHDSKDRPRDRSRDRSSRERSTRDRDSSDKKDSRDRSRDRARDRERSKSRERTRDRGDRDRERTRDCSRERSSERSSRKSKSKSDRSDRSDRHRSSRSSRRDRDRDRDRSRRRRRSRSRSSDSSSSGSSSDSNSFESDDDDRKHRKDRKKGSSSRGVAASQSLKHAPKEEQPAAPVLSSTEREARLRAVREMLNNNPLLRSGGLTSTGGGTGSTNVLDDEADPTARPFVWRKKVEKAAEEGVRVDTSAAAYESKLIAHQGEIVRLQQTRVQRDKEKLESEAFREQAVRDLDMEENLGWDAKEEEFHRLQAMRKSEIRLKDGRARVVDVLSLNVHVKLLCDDPEAAAKAGLALGESQREVTARLDFIATLEATRLSPAGVVATVCAVPALEELLADLTELVKLGGAPWVGRYWGHLRTVTAREIAIARRVTAQNPALAPYNSNDSQSQPPQRPSYHLQSQMSGFRSGSSFGSGAGSATLTGAAALQSESWPEAVRAAAAAAVVAAESGVSVTVAADVLALLTRKNLKSITALEMDVAARLRSATSSTSGDSSGSGGDARYWEVVSAELRVAKARAWLSAFHRSVLRQRVRTLRAQAEEDERALMLEAAAAGQVPRGFGDQAFSASASAAASSSSAAAAAAGGGAVDSAASESQQHQSSDDNATVSATKNTMGDLDDTAGDAAAAAPVSVPTDETAAAQDGDEEEEEDAAAVAAAAEAAAAAAAADAAVLRAVLSAPAPPPPRALPLSSLPPSTAADTPTAAAAAASLAAQRAVVLQERAEEADAALWASLQALQAKKEALRMGAVGAVRADGTADLFCTVPPAIAPAAAAAAVVAAARSLGTEPLDSAIAGGAGSTASAAAAAEDALFAAVAKEQRAGADEEGMAREGEVALAPRRYEWLDRFRPRKPRYFNKVKTGFDWNKYNSTHYDKENPPPKVVQGYKFNIFYPDLVDPRVAPTYRIEPDPEGNPDYCVIRFSAGAPYEDVAFKIVRKQWNNAPKHGFKCVFQRGVLSLWFNFKRIFYRR